MDLPVAGSVATEKSGNILSWCGEISEVVLDLILQALTLSELRHTALSCKLLYNYISSDDLLSWRLKVSGASEFVLLYTIEDSSPRAPTLSPERFRTDEHLFAGVRKIIFDWLVDLCVEWDVSTKTLQTSFHLMDRSMQLQQSFVVSQKHQQLVGITCLHIAATACEPVHNKTLQELVMTCANTFTQDEHIAMNGHLSQLLVPLGISSCMPNDFIAKLSELLQLGLCMESIACYMCGLFMIERHAIGVQPSSIAGACLIVAAHTLRESSFVVGTRSICFEEMAFATRTPISQMRLLTCKVHSLHLMDFFVNGLGQDNNLVVRPKPPSSSTLNAVYRFHSSPEKPTHAALTKPRPAFLQTVGHKCCCGWCGKEACATETLRTMGCFVELCSPP